MGVSAAEDVNIAFNKLYTASAPYTDRTVNPKDYQLIDGRELTDGVKGTTDYGTEWHAFYSQDSYFAKVDLGLKYPGIKKMTMQIAENTGASIHKPKSVEYFVSTDNRTYTSVGIAAATKTGSYGATTLYDYTLELTAPVTARFVRAVLTKDTGMFIFVSEFEVFNSGEPGIDSSPGEVYPDPGEIIEPDIDYNKIIVKPETGMKIVGNYIYGLQPETYYEYALSQFLNPAGLVIKNKDGEVKTSGFIGTGDKVELTVDGAVVDTKTIVIDGDLSGDGKIAQIDYLRFKKAILGNYTLENEYLEAAHIFSTNKLSQTDYLRIKKHILGNYNIYMSKYAEAVIVYPMTLTRTAEKLYTMDTKYNGKPLSLTMHQNKKENWDTWNLGTLTYDGSALAGAATDWEYVYRVSETKLNNVGDYPFCGGNHENEKLKEMKIYDGTTGKEIILRVGETVPVDSIKIVEKTQILFSGSVTPWCNVVRTYYIAGNRIELLVDYEIIRDCYFALSYSCMFPVNRDNATHAQFFNTDKTVSTVNALSKEEYSRQYPNGSGPYLGKLPATKVKIWGDKNPSYSFEVQIYDPKASCGNFKNAEKTFLWEMNVNTPKLYFSKYNTGDAVKAGTTWTTKSTWAFYVNPLTND